MGNEVLCSGNSTTDMKDRMVLNTSDVSDVYK